MRNSWKSGAESRAAAADGRVRGEARRVPYAQLASRISTGLLNYHSIPASHSQAILLLSFNRGKRDASDQRHSKKSASNK